MPSGVVAVDNSDSFPYACHIGSIPVDRPKKIDVQPHHTDFSTRTIVDEDELVDSSND